MLLAINAGHAYDCNSSLVALTEHPYIHTCMHRKLHDCFDIKFQKRANVIYRRVHRSRFQAADEI
jgi:hypothetical protein